MVDPLSMLLPTLASHHSTRARSPGHRFSSCFFRFFLINYVHRVIFNQTKYQKKLRFVGGLAPVHFLIKKMIKRGRSIFRVSAEG